MTQSEAWRNADSIAAFVGVGHEPDTWAVLRQAITEGRALWLPRVAGSQLRWARVENLDRLVRGRFNLTEPPAEDARPGPPPVSLVLVPGLAFGPGGARVGWGRGYYDRTLAALPSDRAARIGLCFDDRYEPSEGVVPMGVHDVRIPCVATDKGWRGDCGDSARRSGQ